MAEMKQVYTSTGLTLKGFNLRVAEGACAVVQCVETVSWKGGRREGKWRAFIVSADSEERWLPLSQLDRGTGMLVPKVLNTASAVIGLFLDAGVHVAGIPLVAGYAAGFDRNGALREIGVVRISGLPD